MTDEAYTVFDPFLGKEVEISERLTDRLRGRYASGPTLPNGEPEFGWREFGPTPPIQLEAAAEIDRLRAELAALAAPQATDPRDATLKCLTCDCSMGAWERCGLSTAPDATDWKARCEAAEEWNRLRAQDIVTLGHLAGQTLAAQAEIEKLRAAFLGYIRNENGCRPAGHHAGCTGWHAEQCGCAVEARAALSPPPLSPEKP